MSEDNKKIRRAVEDPEDIDAKDRDILYKNRNVYAVCPTCLCRFVYFILTFNEQAWVVLCINFVLCVYQADNE